ncbi:hypothetical protein B5M09_007372 [Aphanomyces astaci]|nr:hypothetical protein B5M09_007372 [Aphanomyces astaci]
MLAMVCENRHVKGILDELLSGKGATLDVVPASRYLLDKHERISFHDLVLRAQQMDEIVCGFQPHMSSSYADEPTQLNPSDKTGVYSYWDKMDLVILCEGRREKNVKRMQLACTALWQVLAHKHGRDAINEQGGGDTPAQDDEVQVIPRLEDLAMHSSFRHLKQSSHTATSSFCGRWGSMPPDTQLLQGSSDTIRRQQQRYNAVTPWLSTQAPDRRMFRRPIKARLTELWGMTEEIEDVVAGLGLPGRQVSYL